MAEQTIILLADWVSDFGSNRFRWTSQEGSRPVIIDDLVPTGETRTLYSTDVRATDGAIRLNFEPGQFTSGGVANQDLTAAFETDGTVEYTQGSLSVLVPLESADLTEIYNFIPANAAEVMAFANAVDITQNVTLTLRDFVPQPAVRVQLGAQSTGTLSGSLSARRQSFAKRVQFGTVRTANLAGGLSTHQAYPPPGTTAQTFTAEYHSRPATDPAQHIWGFHSSGYPALDDGFTAGRHFLALTVFDTGGVTFRTSSSATQDIPADLSQAFEVNGSLEINVAHRTLYVELENKDTDAATPYIWIPSNSPEVLRLYSALESNTDDASVTVRDFVPDRVLAQIGSVSTGNLTATVQARKLSLPVRAQFGVQTTGALSGSLDLNKQSVNERLQFGVVRTGNLTGELSVRATAAIAVRAQLGVVAAGALSAIMNIRVKGPTAVRAQLGAVALGALSGTFLARTPPASPVRIDFGSPQLGALIGQLDLRVKLDPNPPLSEAALASKLQIYNMALSAARGRGKLISLDQDTRGREECDKWYDLVVDVTQEAAYWSCCKTRFTLVGSRAETSHDFSYSFELPTNHLRPWYLHTFGRFSLESDGGETRLYTDETAPVLYFAQRVQDSTRWPAGLTQAIVYGLGYKICETLTGNDTLVERNLALANGYLAQGQAASINYSTEGTALDSDPDWITARGSGIRPPDRFYFPLGEVWSNAG